MTAAEMVDARQYVLQYGEFLRPSEYEIVVLHPLADDRDCLDRLQMQPSDCTNCDFYWAFNDTAYFVSVAGGSTDCFVSHHKTDPPAAHAFYVRTGLSPLTQASVNLIADWLSSWITGHATDNPPVLDEVIVITKDDILAAS